MQRFTELKSGSAASSGAGDLPFDVAVSGVGALRDHGSGEARSCVGLDEHREGAKRLSRKDYAHFLNIAEGSLAETEYLVPLSRDLRYLPAAEADRLLAELAEIMRMVAVLRRKAERSDEEALAVQSLLSTVNCQLSLSPKGVCMLDSKSHPNDSDWGWLGGGAGGGALSLHPAPADGPRSPRYFLLHIVVTSGGLLGRGLDSGHEPGERAVLQGRRVSGVPGILLPRHQRYSAGPGGAGVRGRQTDRAGVSVRTSVDVQRPLALAALAVLSCWRSSARSACGRLGGET